MRQITNRSPEQFHPDMGEEIAAEHIITFFFQGGSLQLRHKGDFLDLYAHTDGRPARLTVSPYGSHSLEIRLEP